MFENVLFHCIVITNVLDMVCYACGMLWKLQNINTLFCGIHLLNNFKYKTGGQ